MDSKDDKGFDFSIPQAQMNAMWAAGIRPEGFKAGPSEELVGQLKSEIEHLRKLVDGFVKGVS